MEEEVGDLVWSVGGVGFGGEERRREGRKKAREGMREASEDPRRERRVYSAPTTRDICVGLNLSFFIFFFFSFSFLRRLHFFYFLLFYFHFLYSTPVNKKLINLT